MPIRKEGVTLEDNPYRAMLGVMGGEAGRLALPFVRTGVIVSLYPLTVQAGDLLLDAADLLIDPRLLPRTRAVTADGLEGTADFLAPLGEGKSFSNGEAAMNVHLPGELAVGDRVAMLTPDGEAFIILCKVVGI